MLNQTWDMINVYPITIISYHYPALNFYIGLTKILTQTCVATKIYLDIQILLVKAPYLLRSSFQFV